MPCKMRRSSVKIKIYLEKRLDKAAKPAYNLAREQQRRCGQRFDCGAFSFFPGTS